MKLKIGYAEFEVTAPFAPPHVPNIWTYVEGQPWMTTKVYRWDCRNWPWKDPEGLLNFAVDCEVQFAVPRNKRPRKLNKQKSVKMRKQIEALTGLKGTRLIKAVQEAVKPAQVQMDARPMIKKWGEEYSFAVNMRAIFEHHLLRPKLQLGAPYILIGIPMFVAFEPIITSSCTSEYGPHPAAGGWIGKLGKVPLHQQLTKEWFWQAQAAEEELRREMEDYNELKGIHPVPKKD